MIRWFKDHTTPIGSKAKQENPTLIERGIFVQKQEPEYCEEYEKVVARARGGRS
jgi:2-oxoglutarate ferredoxin oxidoreductase subunit beta